MKQLTPAEAADLAAVCQHRRFFTVLRLPDDGRWEIWMGGTRFNCRTLRAAIKAAVRWIEEQDHAR